MESRLTPQEINRFRGISIHAMLGLTNHGRRISMCCPFHHERNPSFSLYPDNSFHCFSCGANGQNAIDFMQLLMKKQKFDMEILANLSPYL